MLIITQFLKNYWREGVTILVIVALFGLSTCGVQRFIQYRRERATAQYREEINKLKTQATAAKAIAQDAVSENKQLQGQLIEERRNREAAEKLFHDKTKTAQQKRDEYEKIKASPISIVNTGDSHNSTDELCRRAAELGIQCE